MSCRPPLNQEAPAVRQTCPFPSSKHTRKASVCGGDSKDGSLWTLEGARHTPNMGYAAQSPHIFLRPGAPAVGLPSRPMGALPQRCLPIARYGVSRPEGVMPSSEGCAWRRLRVAMDGRGENCSRAPCAAVSCETLAKKRGYLHLVH